MEIKERKDLHTVIVLGPPPPFLKYHETRLSEKYILLKSWESSLSQDEFLITHGHSNQAVICSGKSPITAGVLQLLPMLRLVVTDSAGFNHIDLQECRNRGVMVANAGSVYSKDGADMAVGLLIDVMRKISAADKCMRDGHWPVNYPLGSQLCGKRVGIIGLGGIGLEIAKRLAAFECKISYNSRKARPSLPYKFYPDVHQLSKENDILVVCCSLTEQTHHLINKRILTALGKDGVIINIGRGPLIDEKEMVRRLVDGELKGAGLDVFENEPAVPKELFALDNVVLSPHRAVFTVEAFKDLCNLIIGNLDAFFSNKPLLSPVNIE